MISQIKLDIQQWSRFTKGGKDLPTTIYPKPVLIDSEILSD